MIYFFLKKKEGDARFDPNTSLMDLLTINN